MSKETVIEMAREAGFWQEHSDTWMCNTKDIEAFANLVRADERSQEREACAKVSEEYDDEYDVHTKQTKQGITDSIRARSKT